MKRKYIYLLILPLLLFQCNTDEFLDRPPEDQLAVDNFYQTDEQVLAATAPLYGWPWFDANDKAWWAFGDGMGGNHWSNDGDMGEIFLFAVKANSARLNEMWNSLYRVVAHSNSVINNIPDKSSADVSEEVKAHAIAEARFMRAVAYFYLVRLWGPVTIIENNEEAVSDFKLPRNFEEDVYRFIIMDLEYAMNTLPESSRSAGRVHKWSAEGMLAKVYLAKSGLGQSGSRHDEDLQKAKLHAKNVMESGLLLMDDYGDLFKTEFENNSESLFAFQWVSCLDWGTQNTNQAYWAKDNTITGVGDGWGGYIGPSIDLQNQYERGDVRKYYTIMQDGDFYPNLNAENGGFLFSQEPGGEMGASACHSAVKKYVVGTPEDNSGQVCFMSTAINTYVQRLADVYLIYAEATLGNNASTTDASALEAVNALRRRAKLEEKASLTLDDIYHERRVEFAYEADHWYDLIRLHYWNPQKAIDIVSNQERGTLSWDDDGETQVNSLKVSVDDGDFMLPIPEAEVSKNPRFLDDPESYEFL
ncbi:RagB/SusD family nutrient uptake outer membrane protein [Flammeovirgaceae bacterium SG7u.111]|nr:RagB/SusD family nutrient uptake outer membrane protein [Flammeovirgaceae bacterium SG7u.132]WPO34169.1 RagB/SusD family nutrient uptake outer membrane protein [Flammeovirgaceae bacterium SG7u.111]